MHNVVGVVAVVTSAATPSQATPPLHHDLPFHLNQFYAPSLLHQQLPIATVAAILLALAATAATTTDGVPHRAAVAASPSTFGVTASTPPTPTRIRRRHLRRHQSHRRSYAPPPQQHPDHIFAPSLAQLPQLTYSSTTTLLALAATTANAAPVPATTHPSTHHHYPHAVRRDGPLQRRVRHALPAIVLWYRHPRPRALLR